MLFTHNSHHHNVLILYEYMFKDDVPFNNLSTEVVTYVIAPKRHDILELSNHRNALRVEYNTIGTCFELLVHKNIIFGMSIIIIGRHNISSHLSLRKKLIFL